MKRAAMYHGLAALAIALVSSACTAERSVNAASATQIDALCIQENTRVAQAGFLPELRRQIETRGVRTSVYSGALPEGCRHHMRYTANWGWDLALYLSYAQLDVYEDGRPIGSATYEASPFAVDKFGPTAGKLTPMVGQLFP